MTTPDKPTMRVTNIALDYDETPREITVVASAPIADRINEYMGGPSFAADEPISLPIYHVARIARHFGRLPSPDEVTSEIWLCLTGTVFNRFWDGGLDDYEAPR